MPNALPILRRPYHGVFKYCSSIRRIKARFSADTPSGS
jgi:hypothetical protein